LVSWTKAASTATNPRGGGSGDGIIISNIATANVEKNNKSTARTGASIICRRRLALAFRFFV